MPIVSFSREATKAEMAAEIDRRGAVIEKLEAELSCRDALIKEHLGTILHLFNRIETLDHACMVAHLFVVDELEVRKSSGLSGIEDERDYVGEAREVERVLEAALGIAEDENACPGHIASDHDPKIYRRCGLHIDSLRPEED